MKKIILLFFGLLLINCKKEVVNETLNGEKASQKPQGIFYGETFFEFDEVDYYKSDIDEGEYGDQYDRAQNSKVDKLKFDIVFGDVPESINDTTFIKSMKKIGYSKKKIDSKDFAEFNKIFAEKTPIEGVTAACIPVFRRVLVFKNKGKVSGVAKICFSCHQYEIVGNLGSIESFGSDNDYESLGVLFDKYN
jgi:hypothetical protein